MPGASAVLVTQGTQTNISVDNIGGAAGTNYQVVKLDVGAAGATSPFTGTLGAVTNLAGGTVTALAKGTISAGTINIGTVDTVSAIHTNYFGTTVTSGTSVLGTIISAAGAGTRIYITDLMISVGAGTTEVILANGGTATPLVGTMSFTAFGGLVSNFRTPIRTGTNGTLVFKQTANQTLSITVAGFTGA